MIRYFATMAALLPCMIPTLAQEERSNNVGPVSMITTELRNREIISGTTVLDDGRTFKYIQTMKPSMTGDVVYVDLITTVPTTSTAISKDEEEPQETKSPAELFPGAEKEQGSYDHIGCYNETMELENMGGYDTDACGISGSSVTI
ncbi:uncharacterized protein BDR25DRAFT_308970 [Lindgomyces ingoldianus]|uniref:Uncharacterized protein n=1 Tax=Lindgomyces ingoldianus TaxID=673940 RepID=A0ACB6RGC5_9PLEO|nr:uncharacterized protein BDR25DRAFT_308970 [Lindgomyces ingoldianus]KAF2478166.1 hypothetical protein BDR25DRAFT_308970 [Lindgomyces ingoldianus]